MIAIETRGLSKTFDNGVEAVKEVDLRVERGEIYGFLGPNGSGKTTTIRLLNGTLTPTRGESFVLGNASRDEIIRLKTATVAELAQMYEGMSVYQNLLFFAAMYDLEGEEAEKRIEEQLTRMQLWEKKDLKLGSFSTGMKKRAYLARALLHNPEILFLDEPTSGLDPESARQVIGLIKRLGKENGITVFLCTHNLPLAEGICDTFGFISQGRLIKRGGKQELIDSMWEERSISIQTSRGNHRLGFQDESEINGLIRQVMARGENILEVTRNRPSLEDIYFKTLSQVSPTT
jgi:ABC-2 type transport system ATP-binding protein